MREGIVAFRNGYFEYAFRFEKNLIEYFKMRGAKWS